MEGLQVFSHLAQSGLDLSGLIQDLHAAGKGVIADCEGALDVGRVFPVEINECTLKINKIMQPVE